MCTQQYIIYVWCVSKSKSKDAFRLFEGSPRRTSYYILIIKLRLKLIIITILLCSRRQIATTFLRFLSPSIAREFVFDFEQRTRIILYRYLLKLQQQWSRVLPAIILQQYIRTPRCKSIHLILFHFTRFSPVFCESRTVQFSLLYYFPPRFVFGHTPPSVGPILFVRTCGIYII